MFHYFFPLIVSVLLLVIFSIIMVKFVSYDFRIKHKALIVVLTIIIMVLPVFVNLAFYPLDAFLKFDSPEAIGEYVGGEVTLIVNGTDSAIVFTEIDGNPNYYFVVKSGDKWRLSTYYGLGFFKKTGFVTPLSQDIVFGAIILRSTNDEYYIRVSVFGEKTDEHSLSDSLGSVYMRNPTNGVYYAYIPELKNEFTIIIDGESYDVVYPFDYTK